MNNENCPQPNTDCKCGYQTEVELGRGDFGKAFSLKDDNRVMKEIYLKDEKAENDYEDEVYIGYVLGNMGIAPKIYKKWRCNKEGKEYGYYIMDKLSGVWDKVYEKNNATKNHQYQLMSCIAKMIQSGYLHNDCHVGNIGFVNNNVVLFDFGLSKKFETANQDYLLKLFLSQLYIVIEQYELDNYTGSAINRNYMYDMIQYIKAHPELTLQFIIELLDSNSEIPLHTNTIHRQRAPTKKQQVGYLIHCVDNTEQIPVVFEGLLTYCIYDNILNNYNDTMYDSFLYDTIYHLRRRDVNLNNIREYIDNNNQILRPISRSNKSAHKAGPKTVKKIKAGFRSKKSVRRLTRYRRR